MRKWQKGREYKFKVVHYAEICHSYGCVNRIGHKLEAEIRSEYKLNSSI